MKIKLNMREKLLNAILAKYNAEIELHRWNLEVYLTNSVGVGEHSDISDDVESKIARIAELEGKVATINSLL
jgi:hypothetical protein